MSGYEVVRQVGSPTTSSYADRASCPGGKKVLGGGARLVVAGDPFDSPPENAFLRSSFPDGDSWVASFKNLSSTPLVFTVYAVCGNVAP